MKQGHNYNGMLINCRLVSNKTECIQAEIAEANATLCVLTETWIKEEDDIAPLQLCPSGYKCISIPKKGRSGGGLALIYWDNINLKTEKELTTYLEQTINTTGDTLLMGDLNIHINDPENQDTIIFRTPLKV